MSKEWVKVEEDGSVAIVTLDRAPRNAISFEFACALDDAFRTVVNSDAKAVVLTGTDDVFSAGLDLKEVPKYSPSQQQEMLNRLNRLILNLYQCPIPVVGAINGHAIAGALILVLTTDYRIGPSNEKAQFGLTEARAGIPFPAAPTVVLQNEVSPADVRFLTLYGRNVIASKAQRMGIFDELQPASRMRRRALEIAHDLASIPNDSYERVKLQFRQKALQEIEEIIAKGADPMMAGWVSEEAESAAQHVLKTSTKV